MKNKFLLFAFIVLMVVSCKKDDPKPSYSLSKNELTLFKDGTNQLEITGATTEVFTYTSKNDLIASVDEKGMITGERVGETSINVSCNGYIDSCIVSIMPKYRTFEEPITSFGISKSEVKAKETRKLYTEGEDIIIYEGSILEEYVSYFFDDGKLTVSAVILDSKYSSVLGGYLAERYLMASVSPIFGYSVDNKFMVGATLEDVQNSLSWWVAYVPHDSNKSTSIKSQTDMLFNKYRIEKVLNEQINPLH